METDPVERGPEQGRGEKNTMSTRHVPTFRGQPLEPVLEDGQSVKIIGLGGVGSIVARYGSVFLAALAAAQGRTARVVLIDGDSFELSNTTRMLFSRMGKKASVVASELLPHFESSPLAIDAIDDYVHPENIERLIHCGDIVLLAVDRHAVRKLVSDFCAGDGGWPGLDDVCLITGGNDGVGPDSGGRVRRGTFGTCHAFVRRGGRNLSRTLTEDHEEIREPRDKLPDDDDCIALVDRVQQNLLANFFAAGCVLDTLWLHLCGGNALHYGEIAFDIAEGLMRPLSVRGTGEEGDVAPRG